MSTSKKSLGFARVAATIAAAMITAAVIAVAVLVLAGAGADSAQNAGPSEDKRTDGVAEAGPAAGLVKTGDPILSKSRPAVVNTIHPIIVGGLGHREHRHDSHHDHDRRHAGEVGAAKDSSRPPGVPQPVIEDQAD